MKVRIELDEYFRLLDVDQQTYDWGEAELVPLSVREDGWRERRAWKLKVLREALALRLAPWLRDDHS